MDDDSSATGTSAAFLSITFERLAVSPPSSELGTSRRRRSGRSASGAATAATDPAAGRSESLLLGRNGRRRSAASLIRRSKLTDILRSREDTEGSAVGSAGAADIVPAGAVKDGSDVSKEFGREFSAAFESFASLSLDSKGCKVGGGGEGKVEQKFSSASYRTPSVSMAGLSHLHRNLVLQFNLKRSFHLASEDTVLLLSFCCCVLAGWV